ncbi:hypothetical protein M011DRAFT_285369 [Sporormia fimetaria CBS 119925]|uniref:Prion-inhibition and propagation HeLo domain-containing protein n=1 Tax=Sporormia fimetaria CBS 119925 TaxID=1340428 RepID=A0A6A6VJJ8_9PLEO|nr:hypothetical protein M011DRAFT_285369 [Sporormia fimetaria CBS 119925]
MATAFPPPSTPVDPTAKLETLTRVVALADQFSACVEVFNLIHPSRPSNRLQRIALAKLGLQQGRLLIFGDAIGISSPPAWIARHMIPSHPGATNPDPTLPVNFGDRDVRLEDEAVYEKVRAALNEIAGRPAGVPREELMERYGLKSPKRFAAISFEYPALDTKRLEAFREKYRLLQDLMRATSGEARPARHPGQRGLSMTTQRWVLHDVTNFSKFVRTVQTSVDGLIEFMGVKEQVDRGMKSDIKAMGWHPDLSGGPALRSDYEKLQVIKAACKSDYPEYVGVADRALNYMRDGLRDAGLEHLRPPTMPPFEKEIQAKAVLDNEKENTNVDGKSKSPDRDKQRRTESPARPSLFSAFSFSRWSRRKRSPPPRDQVRSKSLDAGTPSLATLSISEPTADGQQLHSTRSKSMSAVPDAPLTRLTEQEDEIAHSPKDSSVEKKEVDESPVRKDSFVERHDQFKGIGRLETKDIREISHQSAATG